MGSLNPDSLRLCFCKKSNFFIALQVKKNNLKGFFKMGIKLGPAFTPQETSKFVTSLTDKGGGAISSVKKDLLGPAFKGVTDNGAVLEQQVKGGLQHLEQDVVEFASSRTGNKGGLIPVTDNMLAARIAEATETNDTARLARLTEYRDNPNRLSLEG